MTSDPGILAVPSLRELFSRAIQAVVDAEPFKPDPRTVSYLVDLLCAHVERSEPAPEELPSLVVAGGAHRPGGRVRRLKQVGDHSLYVAGYFRPSLRGRTLDLDYYRTVGGGAYRRLSYLLRKRRQAALQRQVFAELAEEFMRFVDLLSLVRSEVDASMAGDVAALYEEWLGTGNEALERRLRAAGLQIDRKDAKQN